MLVGKNQVSIHSFIDLFGVHKLLEPRTISKLNSEVNLKMWPTANNEEQAKCVYTLLKKELDINLFPVFRCGPYMAPDREKS